MASQPTPQTTNNGINKIPTFCAMCGPGAGCGIYAVVENGKFVRVEGMKESPLNKGRLCPKAHAAPQWVYSPQRLKHPLKRTGAKGEGKFEKITWDQALDIIVEKLIEQKKKYGPESLAILSPARRSYSEYLYRFLMVHGSPNYGHSGICAVQNAFSFAHTLGALMPFADYPNSDLILIWGKQPIYSGSSKGGTQSLIKAKERGVRIFSIKPTMEPDATLADKWIPVRPGTDAALALSMLNYVKRGCQTYTIDRKSFIVDICQLCGPDTYRYTQAKNVTIAMSTGTVRRSALVPIPRSTRMYYFWDT